MKSLVNICLNFAAKAPLLAYNSFIEAIYVLNDCTEHGVYSDSQSQGSSDRRPALFAIR
jgi:condensin-2 complex subunit D3